MYSKSFKYYKNGKSYPEPPDWTKSYAYVAIYDITLGDTFVFAANTIKNTREEINWMTHYENVAASGQRAVLEDGKWGSRGSYSTSLWNNYGHTIASYLVWCNQDIYGFSDINNVEGTRYLAKPTYEPSMLTIDYGWTGYGDDGELSELNVELHDRNYSGGCFRCNASGNFESIIFDWYINGKYSHSQTIGTSSDIKPQHYLQSKTGKVSCFCKVTATYKLRSSETAYYEKTYSLQTDIMTVNVTDTLGGGDSGGGTGGGTGGYIEDVVITPQVTGIVAIADPYTVAPGGHSLIEVSVYGVGDYSSVFTAELKGNLSADTILLNGRNSCTLWPAEDETAESLTVKVTSVESPSQSDSVTIYVEQSTTEEEGLTPQKLKRAYWKGYAAAKAMYGGVE